jgi:hypothetical protein
MNFSRLDRTELGTVLGWGDLRIGRLSDQQQQVCCYDIRAIWQLAGQSEQTGDRLVP